MLALPYTLLTVAGLLVVIGLLQPLAARLNLSHTVLLAVVGVFIGVAAGFLLRTDLTNLFNEFAELILDFPVTSTGVLYIFLPVLLFEAALSIDVRRMLEDAAPIFLLAVVAVLVTTAVVGLALWPLAGLPLAACLLLAAIVATTDPAAVVAIFRDLGAPGRLSRLVEGESLLNDATAIALFSVLLETLMVGREPTFGSVVATFLYSFVGGTLVGFLGGRALMMVVPWLRNSRVAEMTLTLALPYIVYILCERHFHVSGVIAVVTAGLVVSALGRRRLDPDNREFLRDVWAQLGFWASSLVFVLASILVPRLMLGTQPFDLLLIGVVALGALLARAAVLFGLLPLLSAARLTQRVSHRYKFVILWGGLRGAVTLALALAVTENRAIDPEIQRFVAILATGFVLFTLLVNGTTLRPMIRLLGIDRLSPIDQALRNQVLALSLSNVRDAIGLTAAEYHIEEGPMRDVLRPYEERSAEATARNTFDTEIADRDRITLGLVTLANRERELLLQHFRHRAVSRQILEQLLISAERLSDAARTGGRTAYNRAARRPITFGRRFRVAHALHRFARMERPLGHQLADRFELLLVSWIVLEELGRVVHARMSAVLGARVTDILAEIVDQRLEATTAALDALRLQYPAYAQAMQRRFLRQSGLRLESYPVSGAVPGRSDRRRSLQQSPARGLDRTRRGGGAAAPRPGPRHARARAPLPVVQDARARRPRQDHPAPAAAFRGSGRTPDPPRRARRRDVLHLFRSGGGRGRQEPDPAGPRRLRGRAGAARRSPPPGRCHGARLLPAAGAPRRRLQAPGRHESRDPRGDQPRRQGPAEDEPGGTQGGLIADRAAGLA